MNMPSWFFSSTVRGFARSMSLCHATPRCVPSTEEMQTVTFESDEATEKHAVREAACNSSGLLFTGFDSWCAVSKYTCSTTTSCLRDDDAGLCHRRFERASCTTHGNCGSPRARAL